jgi:hypothetical protein
MLKYLYTYGNRDGKIVERGLVEISNKGILPDGTPVEDYGFYALCNNKKDCIYDAWIKELFG